MSDPWKEYREAVGFLYALQKFGIKFGLSMTTRLLAAMGNPHEGRRYVHIAGTNGKGSVAAFIASVLQESGLRVGLYTSPHLVRFTERFKINSREIGPQSVVQLVDRLKGAMVPEEPPTYFEAVTAMALAYFAREKTDVAVLEVGMGGRLDATNVITPLVSVITNISLEHQVYLGRRLVDIAVEKAGIIKKGVPVVTGVTQPPVIDRVRSTCRDRGAPLRRLGQEVRYRTTAAGLNYYGASRRWDGLRLGLLGPHQGRNAALALAALEILDERHVSLSSDSVRAGLKSAFWPGRMHVVSRRPTLLLDGAHNPSAIHTLVKALGTEFAYRRLILVIGIMEDKDIAAMLAGIVPHADYVLYTRPVYPRAARPEHLMEKAAPLGRPGEAVPRLSTAIDRARDMADPRDLILVCGSLFTVGEALSHLDPDGYGAHDL